jgi:hypothetical protein
VELDKIFGFDNFLNEVIWCYNVGGKSKSHWARKHDTILYYAKGDKWLFDGRAVGMKRDTGEKSFGGIIAVDEDGRRYQDKLVKATGKYYRYYLDDPKIPEDWWTDVNSIQSQSAERIGYPTQKPEALLERIIKGSSKEGSVVADFFCGGGTTPAVAQRLNRRWIACDQSRIAVAITADRVTRVVEEKIGKIFPVPDFTVEHWGVYEIPKLEKYSAERFREFVVRAFGGKPESVSPNIHGTRHGIPLYVGQPSRSTRITKDDVIKFAEAIFKERHSNFGTMLAWNFGPDAKRAAEILAARENKRVDFVRLTLVRLESDDFREHARSQHKNYGDLLSFVQPPEVRVDVKRLAKLKYEFDVSESVSLNKDGVLANVQWDFDYRDRFSTTPGYALLRDKKTGRAELIAQYEFPQSGKARIACSVQDDQGGEKTVVMEIDVR